MFTREILEQMAKRELEEIVERLKIPCRKGLVKERLIQVVMDDQKFAANWIKIEGR